jgi:methyl-accepting chemotaxis protein
LIRLRMTLFALRRALSLSIVLLAVIAAGNSAYDLAKREWFPESTNKPQTFQERITALTNSLRDASSQVSEIEQEIASRKQLAEQLQAQADLAKKISTLNADQVAAVAQALRGELHNETRSEFWNTTLTNVFFAFLGAAFGEIFRYVRAWRHTRALRKS